VTPARQIGVAPPPQPVDELAAARVKKSSRTPIVAAYVAAAAGIVLAIGAVLWARQQAPKVITKEVDRVVMPATLTPSAARAQLLATAGDVTTLAWTATADSAAKGASGDVVWSASQQKGFMRFVGLAVNDPKQLQYQLWIFDKNRDQAFPVDGGVFDITPAGEVIVPISAKLPVGEPVLFAVTVEQPGGVVVSKRERIVVTAAPKAS
jgi:anti-sigma-K factor RskA